MKLQPLLYVLALSSSATSHADNSHPVEISQYLEKQGPIIEQKALESSAQDQLAVFFCVDNNLPGGKNEGASNPANAYCEVALFIKNSGHWVLGSKQFLGQGSVKSFAHYKLVAESITYAKDDPLCCPSIRRTLIFNTTAGNLTK